MKKVFILTAVLFGFYLSGNSADFKPIYQNDNTEVLQTKVQQVTACDTRVNKAFSFHSSKAIHKSLRKLNPLNLLSVKKASSNSGNYIIAWVLGFLFGLIGVLITFLVYLKHENRKDIVRMAWLGWLTGLLVVLLIII